MPTVELIKPRRLSTHGFIFEKGVSRDDVPIDVALELAGSPRFKVTGLVGGHITRASDPAGRPKSSGELHAAIRSAADDLDVDDEDAFTASGKPHHLAISNILGYSVTAAERDAALDLGASRGGTLEAADGAAEAARSGVRITRVSSRAKKEEALAKLNRKAADRPEEQEAVDNPAPVAADDPTTEEVMEV